MTYKINFEKKPKQNPIYKIMDENADSSFEGDDSKYEIEEIS